MGLDMYLRGEKFHWYAMNGGEERKEDGFKVQSVILELGYWRKHPDLHGFIVETFAEGRDECQRISLNTDALETIITAVKGRRLPHTEGFFFGQSDDAPEVQDRDIELLSAALEWLRGGDQSPIEPATFESVGFGLMVMPVKLREPQAEGQEVTREVYYQASW